MISFFFKFQSLLAILGLGTFSVENSIKGKIWRNAPFSLNKRSYNMFWSLYFQISQYNNQLNTEQWH